MEIEWGNFLGKTTTGGNVYVSDKTSTAWDTDLVYRPEIKYSPPEDIFYRGKRFKIDKIDTVGDSMHGDTEITIHAHRVTTLPIGQTGSSFTSFYADNTPYWSLTMPNDKYAIKKIVVNPKKNATTVIFKDGVVVVVKKAPEDPEADIYSVVAYAVAKRVYGSNSALKREIRDCIVVNLEEK